MSLQVIVIVLIISLVRDDKAVCGSLFPPRAGGRILPRTVVVCVPGWMSACLHASPSAPPQLVTMFTLPLHRLWQNYSSQIYNAHSAHKRARCGFLMSPGPPHLQAGPRGAPFHISNVRRCYLRVTSNPETPSLFHRG